MKKYLKDEMQKYYEIIQCFKSMKNEAVWNLLWTYGKLNVWKFFQEQEKLTPKCYKMQTISKYVEVSQINKILKHF